MLYWVLKYALLGPWLKLLFRPRVEGLEHVPTKGAAIIASNHLSFSDSIFMPLMVRRSRQRFHALEAGGGPDRGRCRARWHIQEDAHERAEILQGLRRSSHDQPPHARIG